MPAIILDLRSRGGKFFRGLPTTKARLAREVLLAMATYWHRDIFPRHFSGRNRSKYQFEKRNERYLTWIKKQQGRGKGRFYDLSFSGESERSMRSLASVRVTGSRAVVRMTAPRHFTNPFVGSYINPKTGQRKTIRRQPDMAGEATRVDAEDTRDLRSAARTMMARRLAELDFSRPQEN